MRDPSLERPAFGRVLPVLLLLLTVFGPISMDLYLPALPALAADLGAATSVAQLTVTACLIGLAGVKIASDGVGAVEGFLRTSGEILDRALHFVLPMTVS